MKKFFNFKPSNQTETNPNTSIKPASKDANSTTLNIRSKLISVKEELKEIKSNVSNTLLSSTNLDQIAKKPTKAQILAELNTKISNTIFSNVQAISDKAYVDYKRIYKYSLDDLDELKKTSDLINEIGKSYYTLVSNFDELKLQGEHLPDVDVDYCVEILQK